MENKFLLTLPSVKRCLIFMLFYKLASINLIVVFPNTSYHFAVINNQNTNLCKMYIYGVEVSTKSVLGIDDIKYLVNIIPFIVSDHSGEDYKAGVRGLRICGKALSQAEVVSDMNLRLKRDESQLMGSGI
jgi:hypothetical protein